MTKPPITKNALLASRLDADLGTSVGPSGQGDKNPRTAPIPLQLPESLPPLGKVRLTVCEVLTWLAFRQPWSAETLIAERPLSETQEHQLTIARIRLSDAMADQRLPTYTDQPTERGPKQIPPERFSKDKIHELIPEENRLIMGGRSYDRVMFFREDLRQCFVPTEPSEREFAGDVAEEGRAPDRSPRGFSESKLEKWYLEIWVPMNEKTGNIPSLKDDWAAAQDDFPDALPSRDSVRGMRKFAPSHWQRKAGRPRNPVQKKSAN